MGIPGHVPCNSISITSVDPINAINIRQIFAFNKITQMILSNCLPNPSPSQPGKSLAIAQIQAFVIADQKCFGNMTVLLRFGSFPFTHHMLLSSDHSLALIFQQEKPDHLA